LPASIADNSENEIYAMTPFKWEQTKQALTIGKRRGKFPGMMQDLTFRIA
jgi:hypothetical protein